MVLVDRETLNVSWELSCSREAHEGKENPGLADQSISDRHQKIYKNRSSTQGSLEELKRKGISKGCNDTYAPLIWLNHHLSEWLWLPGSCPAALQLVLHSTQRPSLPASLPAVILILTWANGAPQTKCAPLSSTNFTLGSLWKLCSYLIRIKSDCWLNNLWQLFAFRVYYDAYSHHKMSKGHKDNATDVDTSHYQNNEIKHLRHWKRPQSALLFFQILGNKNHCILKTITHSSKYFLWEVFPSTPFLALCFSDKWLSFHQLNLV